MTFFQDFRWHESLFFVSSPALQKRQENFEACWSVKKLLKPTRASRTFTGRFYSINQDLHFVILNVISLKWLFFKILDGMKVFYFSFLVQHFKSVKKILKPAGASKLTRHCFVLYPSNTAKTLISINVLTYLFFFVKITVQNLQSVFFMKRVFYL